MDAVEYLKGKARVQKEYSSSLSCDFENPELAVEIVEDFLKSHPKETYKSYLLKVLPNVPLDAEGYPQACCSNYYKHREHCDGNCRYCWNEEYDGDNT